MAPVAWNDLQSSLWVSWLAGRWDRLDLACIDGWRRKCLMVGNKQYSKDILRTANCHEVVLGGNTDCYVLGPRQVPHRNVHVVLILDMFFPNHLDLFCNLGLNGLQMVKLPKAYGQ